LHNNKEQILFFLFQKPVSYELSATIANRDNAYCLSFKFFP
jgi:hypothetical protein